MAGRPPDLSPRPRPSALRRAPVQRRGRERVEKMLDVAAAVIAEKGSDALRMSEVAARAGVSIGSLYQYFPDKAAIIRTLAERYSEEDRACIEAELAGVESVDDLAVAFARLVDACYALFLAEPVRRDIWFGTQVDKALQEVIEADSRRNAALLAEVLRRVRPESDVGAVAGSALLLWHLAEATVRLAVSLEGTEGDALLAKFKRIARREIETGPES